MARKTIDKAAVERVIEKLRILAENNRAAMGLDDELHDYFEGKCDAYRAAVGRLQRLLDNDGKDG